MIEWTLFAIATSPLWISCLAILAVIVMDWVLFAITTSPLWISGLAILAVIVAAKWGWL